jgi:uncharacterized protein
MKVAMPLINNKEFQKMKDIKHHDESVYDHVLSVAYQAYRITYKMGWDWESTIRGALLHDFYLYKFCKRPRLKLPLDAMKHAFMHPITALENASKHFKLNKLECDIIRSHMFPVRIPRHKESFVVSFVDKYLAVYEYYLNLRKATSKTYKAKHLQEQLQKTA